MKKHDACSALARRLVQHAARTAPRSLSERLEEEWLAHLETRSGRTAQLLFGIGCCWATRAIAYDFCEEKVAATSSTAGPKTMTAYAPHDSSLFSRRTIVLFVIVGLHGLLIYALQTGLGSAIVPNLPTALEVAFLKEAKPPVETPPPPAQPDLARPTLTIPEPVFKIDEFIIPQTIAEVATTRSIEWQPQPPQKAIKRVIGGPGKGFPATDDYYPAIAKRLGEKGVATVRVCVGAEGQLLEVPAVAQTSGSARLDEAALKLANAGSGHYRATTEDGQPVSSCYAFRIRFELRD